MGKKWTFALIFALAFGSVFGSAAYSAALSLPIRVVVDDRTILFPDARPFLDDRNRIQVPVRMVAEALGAKVTWNDKKRQAVFEKDATRAVLTIGKRQYEVNGRVKTMDTEAVVVDGRTFVPARYVAEALGAEVKWDAEVRAVYIRTDMASKTKGDSGEKLYDGIAFNPDTDRHESDGAMMPEKAHEFSLKLMRNIRFVKENGQYVIKGSYPALPEGYEWRLLIMVDLKNGDGYAYGPWKTEDDNRIPIPAKGTFHQTVPISGYGEVREIRVNIEVLRSGMQVSHGYFSFQVVEDPEKSNSIFFHNWLDNRTTYYGDDLAGEVIRWR